MSCDFCDHSKIADRLFYEDNNWIAFLDTAIYTKGHTIIAAKTKNEMGCPQGLGEDVLIGFNSALAGVVKTLKEYYDPKEVLVASLRGKTPHHHWHLIPLYESEEKRWRCEFRHDSGYLFGFLGYLEKEGVARAEQERKENGWNKDEQRSKITRRLDPELKALRHLSSKAREQ